jgi:biotin transporter BioY
MIGLVFWTTCVIGYLSAYVAGLAWLAHAIQVAMERDCTFSAVMVYLCSRS